MRANFPRPVGGESGLKTVSVRADYSRGASGGPGAVASRQFVGVVFRLFSHEAGPPGPWCVCGDPPVWGIRLVACRERVSGRLCLS